MNTLHTQIADLIDQKKPVYSLVSGRVGAIVAVNRDPDDAWPVTIKQSTHAKPLRRKA